MSLMGLDVESVDHATEYLCPEECGCGTHSTLVLQVEYDEGMAVDRYWYCPCCGWDCIELPENIETL